MQKTKESMLEQLKEAAAYIEKNSALKPDYGLILGSGLGIPADEIEDPSVIPYQNIPNFPVSTVQGHAGELVIGKLQGKAVLVMKGRFHYYEGYTMQEVVFPVRVMKLLGIQNLLVTNAAGGVNEDFRPGDLMVISDHIKFFDESPLRGPNIDDFGPRFNDLSKAYTPALRILANSAAKKLGIGLREGVYAHMAGPSFETPAEIRMLRTLGADAVGMSTVPEVIAAAHCGMRILGVSCITNMAAGILDQPLNHEEVMETGKRVQKIFSGFVRTLLSVWEPEN